jgi:hypothetical protein
MFTPPQHDLFSIKVYLSGATEYQKFYSEEVPQYVNIYLSQESLKNNIRNQTDELLAKEILHKVLASSDVLVNIHGNFCEIKYHGPSIIEDIFDRNVYLCVHQDH